MNGLFRRDASANHLKTNERELSINPSFASNHAAFAPDRAAIDGMVRPS
ncbi:hypothetical protein DEA8626_02530 [Defluviimonas aquaemixtae]|uniref:Uncharacterized protein n=1 Tax=Albidovulum aquaemixtae TaxID=1542388 RepID=A0A2R8BJE0_9RHOB|nr:hypothetical protein DEA8626_02530 [Defluviimonas aquaemixtae]